MKSLAVLVVVVGLAVGCNSIKFRGYESKVDFGALNKHLLAKLGDNEDRAANLAVIKADMAGFDVHEQMGIKLAAEAVAELAEVTKASDCEDDIMRALRMAATAGMSPDGELAPEKRVERLFKPELILAMEICTRFIVRAFPVAMRNEDVDLRIMSKLISPDEQEDLPDEYEWPGSDFLAKVLRRLSSADPENKKDAWTYGQTSKLRMFEEPAIFDYAYTKYLADPCAQLRHSLGKYFLTAKAIAKMRGQLGVFGTPRFAEFRQMARTNYLCKRISGQADNPGATSGIYLSSEGY